MGGSHEAAVGIADGNGIAGGTFVQDRSIDGAKIGSTASVGNGEVVEGFCGGRT